MPQTTDPRLEQDVEAPGLGDLIRQLGRDLSALLRQEIALAKMEVGSAVGTYVADGVQVLIAVLLAAVGGLVLVVAMILGLGVLLGGAYWAGALITGSLILLVGGLMARRAIRELQRTSLKPEATVDTLKQDARWAKEEIRELKRGVAG